MDIVISNTSGVPIYEQISAQIKKCILSGVLCEDEALPSIRALAKDLRVSVITTKRAYDDLEQQGYIYTVAAKGCFVAHCDKKQIYDEHWTQISQYLEHAVELAKLSRMDLDDLVKELKTLYGR